MQFHWQDIELETQIRYGYHHIDGRALGVEIIVPTALHHRFPYNISAYQWLQQLRQQIFDFGIIELPGLPVNKQNYTLAQQAPQQHLYSDNHYLTDFYQFPHQDTPPHPTAFWLPEPRRYSATWVVSSQGLMQFQQLSATGLDIASLHHQLVPQTLAVGNGVLLNQQPGLLLIDNSSHCQLYHARTSLMSAQQQRDNTISDVPMYAYNEIGLLHHLQQLDSRRGCENLDRDEQHQVARFLNSRF